MIKFKHAVRTCILSLGSLALCALPSIAQDRGTDAVGALYVLTNSPIQNAVAVWRRDASGQLTPAGFVSTGGSGTGDFLDAQGSLVLSEDKERLFAVNALSNEISVFAVDNN